MYLKLFTKDDTEFIRHHIDQLEKLVADYFNEIHKEDSTTNYGSRLDFIYSTLIHNHSWYLLFNKEDDVVGFLVVYLNDQYGNTKPALVVDYMYIDPEYRSGIAISKLYQMIGNICVDYNCDGIGTTFLTSANNNNNKLVDGIPLATVTLFKLEDIQKNIVKFNKRKSK